MYNYICHICSYLKLHTSNIILVVMCVIYDWIMLEESEKWGLLGRYSSGKKLIGPVLEVITSFSFCSSFILVETNFRVHGFNLFYARNLLQMHEWNSCCDIPNELFSVELFFGVENMFGNFLTESRFLRTVGYFLRTNLFSENHFLKRSQPSFWSLNLNKLFVYCINVYDIWYLPL